MLLFPRQLSNKAIKDIVKYFFPDLIAAYHGWRLNKIYGSYKQIYTKYGFKLLGNEAMLSVDFESEETAIIIDLVKDADVFIDVGANIGYYTCIVRSLRKHVLSIEPLKENLDCLYSNLTINHWEDVEVLPIGLSDKPGLATFYGGSTSASLIKKWAGTSELLKRTISLSTLDIVLKNRFHGKKCVIKIDVEGAEYNLLRGAKETLSMEPAPVWIVEICLNENQPEIINKNFKETFEMFWKSGYKATVADSSLKEVSFTDVERWIRNKKIDFGYINYLFKKTI